MKNYNVTWIAVALILAGTYSASGQISSVESREKLLAKAIRFNAVPLDAGTEERFANASDPFHAPEIDPGEGGTLASDVEIAPPTVADRIILLKIGEMIEPTGVMEFGKNTLLLFGERRLKVGEFISVPYEGRDYKIQLVKADARGFMLRLNEEFISKRIQ